MERIRSSNSIKGKPLAMIMFPLVEHYGWKQLGDITNIKCFTIAPSYRSGIKYLKKTPSAKKRLVNLYRSTIL